MGSKISIIVPVYKTEKYLNKCIDSIISQTYEDFELILVDDGSPDNCGKICDEYAEKDARIKVIHKENSGVSDSRNLGLEQVLGDYVTFVDSDDFVVPQYLSRMMEISREYSADCVQISFGRDEAEFSNNNIKPHIEPTENARKMLVLDRKLRPEICGKLFSSELLRGKIFCNDLSYAEDYEFVYRVFENVKSAVVSNEKLYFYRENPEGSKADPLSIPRLNEPKIMYAQMKEEIENKELFEALLFRYIRCLFAVLNRIVTNNREDLFDDFKNRVLEYKKEIFKNKYLGKKYRFGTVLLISCKSFSVYRFVITSIFKRG